MTTTEKDPAAFREREVVEMEVCHHQLGHIWTPVRFYGKRKNGGALVGLFGHGVGRRNIVPYARLRRIIDG